MSLVFRSSLTYADLRKSKLERPQAHVDAVERHLVVLHYGGRERHRVYLKHEAAEPLQPRHAGSRPQLRERAIETEASVKVKGEHVKKKFKFGIEIFKLKF